MKHIVQIKQIEVTTRCNLRCKYCPHPKMQRPKEDMSWETFEKALKWVKYFLELGLQRELSFTGIGESTMHPQFPAMLQAARALNVNMPIVFSTNGLPTFTEEIASLCQQLNVGVMVSLHRPEVAGKSIEIAKKYGVLKYVNTQFADSAFNWAGQVDNWYVSAPKLTCEYLRSGWGVVLFDGKITTCCLDAENKGVVGTVDDAPGSLKIKPFSLCANCHMELPREMVLTK
jgi:hypothetical protein